MSCTATRTPAAVLPRIIASARSDTIDPEHRITALATAVRAILYMPDLVLKAFVAWMNAEAGCAFSAVLARGGGHAVAPQRSVGAASFGPSGTISICRARRRAPA